MSISILVLLIIDIIFIGFLVLLFMILKINRKQGSLLKIKWIAYLILAMDSSFGLMGLLDGSLSIDYVSIIASIGICCIEFFDNFYEWAQVNGYSQKFENFLFGRNPIQWLSSQQIEL